LIDVPDPSGSVLATLRAARAEGRLTRTDVIDEAMTMLVAGHETSALSLTYLFAELGLNPQLQQPLAAEAREYSQPPSPSDVMRRGDVHRAVLEGLRLYPVAWAVGREARSDVNVLGHDLRRGTQVYLFSWSSQRSLRYFERPLEFWPGRWEARPLAELPSGLFSPFGLGPRICIGRQFALSQIAVTLAEVLRAFRIETVSPFPPRLRASITARPHDPVLIRVLSH
jgi:cytochrome P450